MKQQPDVSILMSVYNGEKYLSGSIQSILCQTVRNFEFIIINDGSSDKTGDILRRYASEDDRIILIDQEQRGLTKSLNRGLQLARGRFVARMDADDISLPRRIEIQMMFLERRQDIGILGSWYDIIDEQGDVLRECHPPLNHAAIQRTLFYGSPPPHPSWMVRKEIYETNGYYDERYYYAQDRDFLLRAMRHTEVAVVPEVLMKYRYQKEAIGLKQELEQKRYWLKAVRSAIQTQKLPFWYRLSLLRISYSLYLPAPLRTVKNKLLNQIGFRHSGL